MHERRLDGHDGTLLRAMVRLPMQLNIAVPRSFTCAACNGANHNKGLCRASLATTIRSGWKHQWRAP